MQQPATGGARVAISLEDNVFNHLSGYAAETDLKKTGNNTALSPDSTHIVYAGSATAESNLSQNSTQIFGLEIIDKAVLTARTLTPVIRPLNNEQEPGKHMFVGFITPEQHYDLRRGTGTGEYQDIQKYALSADASKKNPILSGSIGVYNGVVLHETIRLPEVAGASAGIVGRGVLCGAQSAVLAFGRGYSKSRMSWSEKLFDYDNQLGVKTGVIAGLKKTRYNSRDFATVVMSAAHSVAARAASQR